MKSLENDMCTAQRKGQRLYIFEKSNNKIKVQLILDFE